MAYEGLRNVDLSGILGGMLAVDANNTQQGLQEAQTLNTIFQANQAGANTRYRDLESERYGQVTPFEVAQQRQKGNLADLMNTPEALDTLASGERGQALSRAAKGRVDTETAPGAIASTNSGNAITLNQNQAAQALTGVAGLYANALRQGPAGQAAFNQALSAIPITDAFTGSMVEALRNAPFREIPKVFEGMKQAISNMSPANIHENVKADTKFSRDRELVLLKEAGDDRRTSINNNREDTRNLRQIYSSTMTQINSLANTVERAKARIKEDDVNPMLEARIRKELSEKPENKNKKGAELNQLVRAEIAKKQQTELDSYEALLKNAMEDAKRVEALLTGGAKPPAAKEGEWKVVK